MSNFWWSAGLVNGLEPHPPPLSSHKSEMFIFGLCSTSDDRPGWSMDSSPIRHPSPAKKVKCSFLDCIQLLMVGWASQWTRILSTTPLQPKKWNAHFWITFNFWWSARLVNGLEPHLPPLSSQKSEMLIFGLSSTSDDRPGWSMDSSPICHPSPAKEWNAHFWIAFNFWWSAGQVDGLEPHLPPLSSQKNEMHFWITFNFWWSDGLVNGLKARLPPLSSQKSEMLILGLRSTSDDRPGWLMDLNPVHHPSPAKKLKCSFLDYVQLLMISQAGHQVHFTIYPTPFHYHILILCLNRKLVNFNFKWTYMYIYIWTQTPSATPLQPNKMKCSFLDYIQLLMIGQAGRWTGTPSTTSLQPKIWNAHFRITFNFWWSAGLVDGLEPCPPPLSSQKSEMLIFGLHSPSDDRPGWSMDLNPICHPSLAKKVKCSFLDYVQLLMIGRAGQWTWTPPTTPL